MSKSKLLLTAIAMTLSSSLYAQNHKFAGTVVDANGEPIIGATVNVKGSKENAITDIDGRFSISAAPGQTLVINYIGFSPLETKAADNMQLTLSEDRQTLNDVVVVGLRRAEEERRDGFHRKGQRRRLGWHSPRTCGQCP